MIEMDHEDLLKQVYNLEASMNLLFAELQKTKKILENQLPQKLKKGNKDFTPEDAARIRAKIRMKVLGY